MWHAKFSSFFVFLTSVAMVLTKFNIGPYKSLFGSSPSPSELWVGTVVTGWIPAKMNGRRNSLASEPSPTLPLGPAMLCLQTFREQTSPAVFQSFADTSVLCRALNCLHWLTTPLPFPLQIFFSFLFFFRNLKKKSLQSFLYQGDPVQWIWCLKSKNLLIINMIIN